MHSKKEGDFIWSICHKALADNSWRARFIMEFDDKCCMCNVYIPKTIAHRFWGCRIVVELGILPLGSLTPRVQNHSKMSRGDHLIGNMGFFGKNFTSILNKISRIWHLLRGITLWTIWVERNDLTSNNRRWEVN